MSLVQARGAQFDGGGTAEPVDGLGFGGFLLANLSLRGEFSGSDAGSNDIVKDQGLDTTHLMSGSLVAKVELVADVRVQMVEDTIGTCAFGIAVLAGRLNEEPVAAVHIVWQLAFAVVHILDVKNLTIRTELLGGHVIHTDVVEITLLRIGEKAIGFGTNEGGLSQDRRNGEG